MNKYEFKIEDINKVIIKSTSEDEYTVTCTRKIDVNGTPSRIFVETYSAKEDIDEHGTPGVICPRCGTWNYCEDKFTYNKFKDTNPEKLCTECDEKYLNEYDEKDLVDVIMDLFEDEETFFGVNLYINDIHII